MGGLLDALHALRVEKTSADSSVRVIVTGDGDTFVKLLATKNNGIDADLLAEHIENTVKESWERFHGEQSAVRARFGLHPQDPEAAPLWVHKALSDIQEIECKTTSSRGYVEAFLSGSGDLLIDFTQNSATRTDVSKETLELEINEAIVSARRSLARETMRCYQRYRAV